jgi:hypothetical protein
VTRVAFVLVAVLGSTVLAGGQVGSGQRPGPLDQILDTYVRDGEVYYRALKQERASLDRYVGALASASIDQASRAEQIAFWVNAYNALVLRTIVDRYPIAGKSPDYPARSIRQIPGAFERIEHRVAGRSLTLDAIEQTVLPPFGDPRVFLALGRGAMGSGRLKSEAYTASRLEQQLSEVAAECLTRAQCVEIDRTGNRLLISSIFSWRRDEFVTGYAAKADSRFASRSPIEQAVVAFISPRLLPAERAIIDANGFQVQYTPFDWSLNDLTGR